MANSRLEKVGTIYSRVTGLMQAKAVNWEDRPLWYDIYTAFPPKEEPRYDRPAPNLKLKNIFYQDDKIRAIFHRNNKHIGTIYLEGSANTLTQKFIGIYKKVNEQYKSEATEEQLYKEAIDIINRERGFRPQMESEEAESISLSSAFKDAQKKQQISGMSIKDIFNS